MPSKEETKSVKAEIRQLKSVLKKETRAHVNACDKLRSGIVKSHKKIEQLSAKLGSLEVATDRRIAVLQGRLNS